MTYNVFDGTLNVALSNPVEVVMLMLLLLLSSMCVGHEM